MLRVVVIGICVLIGLTPVVVGGASLIGVPEKWFGSLYFLCALAAAFTGAHLLVREDDHQRR